MQIARWGHSGGLSYARHRDWNGFSDRRWMSDGLKYFIAGGAGFIGSHLIRRLLEDTSVSKVVAFDNLSSGQKFYLDEVASDDRFTFVEGDLKDLELLNKHIVGCEHVYHLAANPDIAKAVTEPGVDFWQGTYLTHNVLEASRVAGVKRITYTSGSGVYGDFGNDAVKESLGPLFPISTYGASKLGCEAMLSAYSHMFNIHAVAFRFANVVGARQTHGVVYDFVRRLLDDSSELTILGDGSQSKSYIHVTDVIDAMLLLEERAWEGFDVLNASTEDYATVQEIADMVIDQLDLREVKFAYTGGKRGWKGDVPVVRFDSSKLRKLGWRNKMSSSEALVDSIQAIIGEARRQHTHEGATTAR